MNPSTRNSPPSTLLEAHGVGRREPNSDNWLLRDVDLSIERGGRLAIVGPTGSGKTLLMRALSRLDAIDAGEILWQGSPILGDAIPRFRQDAIHLHQRPALLDATVEENLRLPFTFRCHRASKFSREEIILQLEVVHRTESFLDRSSRDLSGGEMQIVALLRAIQLQPSMLLLDEPTAALDDESTEMIEQLIDGWFESSPAGRAFVWVSHDKRQVARVANRVMSMNAGKLFDAENDQESLP